MDYNKRLSMYKQMSSVEPRMWSKWHYYIRTMTNSLCTCLGIYLYVNHNSFHKTQFWSKLYNSSQLKIGLYYSSCLAVVAFAQYLNYIVLDDYIYKNYYSTEIIPDEEYDILHMEVYLANVKLNEFKSKKIY